MAALLPNGGLISWSAAGILGHWHQRMVGQVVQRLSPYQTQGQVCLLLHQFSATGLAIQANIAASSCPYSSWAPSRPGRCSTRSATRARACISARDFGGA